MIIFPLRLQEPPVSTSRIVQFSLCLLYVSPCLSVSVPALYPFRLWIVDVLYILATSRQEWSRTERSEDVSLKKEECGGTAEAGSHPQHKTSILLAWRCPSSRSPVRGGMKGVGDHLSPDAASVLPRRGARKTLF